MARTSCARPILSSVDAAPYLLLSIDNLLNRTGFSGVEPTTAVSRSVVGLEVVRARHQRPGYRPATALDHATMTTGSEVWLFGSAARGEMDARSDVDAVRT
jgi:hypothetical protein